MDDVIERLDMKKYSGKQVVRAGEALIDPAIVDDKQRFDEAFDVLSYWRYSHEASLNNAFEQVKAIAIRIDNESIFAKRLKRYPSIISKLRRFPEMKLRNVQDIGGCRVIVSNLKKVDRIVRELKSVPEIRGDKNRRVRYKDYIKKPKDDGYRGYHLVGKFRAGNGEPRNIEIQVRTRLQHDWATALEIVDLFTGQALKSSRGDEKWAELFLGVSKQFALMESIPIFETLDNYKKFKVYEDKVLHDELLSEGCKIVQSNISRLKVVDLLAAFSESIRTVDEHIKETSDESGYVIIVVNTKLKNIEMTIFESTKSEDAEGFYSNYEKMYAKNHDVVIAMVSSGSVGDIKEAYPNYFADSADFLQHLAFIRDVDLKKKKTWREIVFGAFR